MPDPTMLRRHLLVLPVLLAVVLGGLLLASPAAAITNGAPDGNGHPNVGGLVSDTQYADGTWIYCSGTLVAPTVFLTAAHCGTEDARVGVTFDTAYEAGDPVYYGTFHADRLYPGNQSDAHDLAVVVLDAAVPGIVPAQLPGPARCRRSHPPSASPPSATAPTRSPTDRAAIATSTTTAGWSPSAS